MSKFHSLAIAGLGAVLVLSPLAVVAQSAFTSDPAQVQAGDYRLDSDHSKVTWSINHFGYSTYVGQFSKVEGTVSIDPKKAAASKLDVTIDANSVGTLNAKLDAHLKTADFLDTARFPTATFKATTIKLTGKRTANITGDLTLHGVTRPVTVAATFNQAGVNPVDKTYSLGFAGKAKIKRTDFGINAYAPALGDEVTLDLEAELKKVG
ncbi:MAG: YceI family protein [Caulobacter sp.]|nr:YceI family protein [Caulobacter sp.]